jgi:hypothetical protein
MLPSRLGAYSHSHDKSHIHTHTYTHVSLFMETGSKICFLPSCYKGIPI